jgi:hypothetical protein
MRDISWLAEELLVSQEGRCSLEVVGYQYWMSIKSTYCASISEWTTNMTGTMYDGHDQSDWFVIQINVENFVLLTVCPSIILKIKPTWCTIFLSIFTSFLFMFRATMCPSSGETTVCAQLFLVFLLLFCSCFGRLCAHHQEKQLYFIPPCITDSHPYRTKSSKSHINTVLSPDYGHIFAWNM